VTPQSVALLAERDKGVGDGVPQRGRERVQLYDVGPWREVRVAPVGNDGGGAEERLRMLGELVLAPAKKAFRPIDEPRVIGGDVVGNVVEDQTEPPVG